MDVSVVLGWLVVVVAVVCLATAVVVTSRSSARATRRAEELVRRFLSKTELEQLDTRSYLDVPSRTRAGRYYRVPAYEGIVAVFEDGFMVQRLCIRTSEQLPSREHVLAHKAMLEASEDEYMRRAVVVWPRQAAPRL
jgi:hypothetical protein